MEFGVPLSVVSETILEVAQELSVVVAQHRVHQAGRRVLLAVALFTSHRLYALQVVVDRWLQFIDYLGIVLHLIALFHFLDLLSADAVGFDELIILQGVVFLEFHELGIKLTFELLHSFGKFII